MKLFETRSIGEIGGVSHDKDAACRRALGYLELGLPEDALAELDEIRQPDAVALHLRVDALFRLGDWATAAAICLPMTEQDPADPGWWIQAAYAQRRAASIQEAEMILLAGLTRHPADAMILYNLACYSCVLGRPEDSREYFHRAMATDPEPMLKMGLIDPDLEAIRPWLLELLGAHRSSSNTSA